MWDFDAFARLPPFCMVKVRVEASTPWNEVSLSVEKLLLAKRISRSGLQIKPDVVVPSWIATRDTQWTLQNYTTVKIERWPLAQHFTIFLNNLWAWHGNQIVSINAFNWSSDLWMHTGILALKKPIRRPWTRLYIYNALFVITVPAS